MTEQDNTADQVREFFETLGTTQTGHRLIIGEYIAQGDKVATTGRYSAVVKRTWRTHISPRQPHHK